MPTDIAKLEKLGLRDIPRWYREKFSVPSLLQTNYGNLHRGEHNQAAGDHLANNAILNHPAANNAGTVGTSTHATGITNAANNASTSGPSGHANSTPKAAINASKAGSSDHSHNINNARTAGTSVYATGITKAANSASKAGPSGHTHGNGNVAHNAGQKNNGNNGNHNGPAHPRGGRSKTPRGAGFGADKSRGNSYWAKNGQRNGVTPPPANVDKETGGDDTPGSISPNTSGGSSFSISSGAARIDLLATPMVDPMPNVSISGQHILDKDGMARKNAVTARLRRLTPEDTYGPIPEEEQEEPVRNFFRAKTRHVFNFGVDGTNKLAAAFDPYASPAEDETSGRATAPALTPMIRELVAAFQPIDPNELLTNWGPIGEPVQRPAHATYAMALIKGQAENGFNGKFAYPYMGQH
ncbi:hypothetical protein F1880_004288 [Penicillium rolfsii]|nr:hypothetical protein F1880_004288 [Penicillium rolfsii]